MSGHARNDNLVRVLRVATRLQGGRCSLMDLARDFNVHKRTIRRDCDALLKAGYAVRHEVEDDARGRGGLWWIERVPRADVGSTGIADARPPRSIREMVEIARKDCRRRD